jgi:peroxiredoxin Q/BCP
MANGEGLRVGDPAPDFALPATTGATVHLADYRGKSAVVLFFYPRDNSPACSLEACTFRDRYEMIRDAGAEVIGVSGDTVKSHQKFADRLRLPYLLLSDTDDALRSRYRVPKMLGLVPGRVTYLIDKHGIIRYIHSSQFLPLGHAGGVLDVLKTIQAEA